MYLGCYGRGGPLSPCETQTRVRAENHISRRSRSFKWLRALLVPTRVHAHLGAARSLFFIESHGASIIFGFGLKIGRAGGWPLWARIGCIQTRTAGFGRVSARSFDICGTCRGGCLPFLGTFGGLLAYRGRPESTREIFRVEIRRQLAARDEDPSITSR